MTRASAVLRSVLATGLVLSLGVLTGCGGESGSASGGTASGSISSTSNPTIAGIPATTAVANQPYSFTPKTANAQGTVRFTVNNLPAWAKFDTATGEISGTPSAIQVGDYSKITISLVANGHDVALPAFTISVLSSVGATSSVSLSWEAPTSKSDGSTLGDLKGYKVHYGPESRSYSDTIEIANPGLTSYVVQNLPKGTYYFAVSAYNGVGDSTPSGEVTTQVD